MTNCFRNTFSQTYMLGCPDKLVTTCDEHSSKYVVLNSDNLYCVGKLKYDGSFYTGHKKAADYIYFTCEKISSKRVAIIVELKGVNAEDALKQINVTIDNARDILNGYAIVARIVPKSVPSVLSNAVSRSGVLKRLKRINSRSIYNVKDKSLLKVKNRLFSENIDDLYKTVDLKNA